jgi:secreted PhoX family phosphatase
VKDDVFSSVLGLRLTRRALLRSGAVLVLPAWGCATLAAKPVLGFKGVPPSTADRVTVPEGYRADVLYAWGDATGIGGTGPAFRFDAGGSAADQALQAGMHHDGMEFFPLPQESESSAHGLLAMNHEYTDEGLLHPDGQKTWNAAKTSKSQSAQGASVIEVERRGGRWEVVRPSSYARRITAYTPMRISGPAAGHALMRTAADPSGTEVLGTFANCAAGRTPWGTYLTCEENFQGYFLRKGKPNAREQRYGIGAGLYVRWHETDSRFNADANPNEPNRFGWVVEIDPYRRDAQPVKRTALGRIKHEGAAVTLSPDRRVVVYMGDDEPFERIYKFVSRGRYDPTSSGSGSLLDDGTLYVARFDADGSGRWLPLVHGEGPLTAVNGFADQAHVLVGARLAADVLGGTRMDRPEWITVHPATGEVYCTLTGNGARGGPGGATDAANPRAGNFLGHIIRWRERGGHATADAFTWDIFALAGDPAHREASKRGSVRGDAFGCPDGLKFDARGVLWIQTDAGTSQMRSTDFERIGNNQMLAADAASGEVRRFLVGPPGCEVTGLAFAPDRRTMFVNIQHPGEGVPSAWPDYRPGGKPRSATIVVRREDDGEVGT